MIAPRGTEMKLKGGQAPVTPYERLQDQVIRSHGQSLELLLDFIAPEEPASIQKIRFGKQAISMTLRFPFLLPPADDPGEYLGTVKARAQFREGLRKYLSGPEAGKHLSNALFKELRAFTVLFTGGHRWGKRVLEGLNSVGERRMGGRPSKVEIEKQEAEQIRREALIIQSTVTEISRRAKSLKSRGPALRRKILKDYGRDQYPWIGSLFPALRDLHGTTTLEKLDTQKIHNLITIIIQRERYRKTGTLHFLGAINKLLRLP
jgi:hypothetical protein